MLALLADSSSGSAMMYSLILVVVLVVGWMVVMQLRKWLFAPDEPTRVGFTLSDLRRMRSEGRMTEDEFEKAKALIIGAAKAPTPKPAKPADPRNDSSSQV